MSVHEYTLSNARLAVYVTRAFGVNRRAMAALELLTRDPLDTAAAGRRLVTLLQHSWSAGAPTRYGDSKPSRRFDIDRITDDWASPVVWHGTHATLEGFAHMALGSDDRGVILIYFEPSPGDGADALMFLKRAAAAFEAEFAYLQILT